ncbi:MAG: 16S rRNA (guanine(966)-N(2))-methyltransferase RsmD [Lachnospiraceae bacterium]|nr:16S rRNA (guanine(966)-N(2))-methyltransferase RsmD [Lachnospiraceae bacterium]
MRVIAGTARSLPLKTIEGLDTRPTTDRIKETLFNMLTGYIPDAKFLDLFAGSGGIGIEALSRGAKDCTFIELNPKAIACIEDNVTFTHFKDNSRILKADAVSYVSGLKTVDYDVIFMDPPYGKGLERQVLSVLKEKNFTEDTLIIVEAALDEDFSYVNDLGYDIIKDKRYKSNKHIFFKKRE